jgi:hypothetical protein
MLILGLELVVVLMLAWMAVEVLPMLVMQRIVTPGDKTR